MKKGGESDERVAGCWVRSNLHLPFNYACNKKKSINVFQPAATTLCVATNKQNNKIKSKGKDKIRIDDLNPCEITMEPFSLIFSKDKFTCVMDRVPGDGRRKCHRVSVGERRKKLIQSRPYSSTQ